MADEPRKRCGELSGKLNANGQLCRAYARKGKPTCIGHADKAEQDEAGFGGPENGRKGGAAGRRPRPTEVMRRLVEQHVEAVLAPHFRTLGYDVVRDEETGELTIVANPGGGAKIYGESKDGDIRLTTIDDLGAHIAAAEKLLDRVYGRPRQTTEISGPGGGKLDIDISSSEIEDARSAFLAAFPATALHQPSRN